MPADRAGIYHFNRSDLPILNLIFIFSWPVNKNSSIQFLISNSCKPVSGNRVEFKAVFGHRALNVLWFSARKPCQIFGPVTYESRTYSDFGSTPNLHTWVNDKVWQFFSSWIRFNENQTYCCGNDVSVKSQFCSRSDSCMAITNVHSWDNCFSGIDVDDSAVSVFSENSSTNKWNEIARRFGVQSRLYFQYLLAHFSTGISLALMV